MSPSNEVTEAVGIEGETLEQRAARLRQVVATKSEREVAIAELFQVETQLAEQHATNLRREAEKRVTAIKRAHGSLTDQLDNQDVRKVLAAAQEFAAAWERMVRRYLQLGT